MDNNRIDLSETEERQCRQVIELFSDYLSKREELCVVRTNGYGYVVLCEITSDYFETNKICRCAQALYDELLEIWEVDYLFETGAENDCSSFEESEEKMTEEQQAYREQMRSYYRQGLERILSGEEETEEGRTE